MRGGFALRESAQVQHDSAGGWFGSWPRQGGWKEACGFAWVLCGLTICKGDEEAPSLAFTPSHLVRAWGKAAVGAVCKINGISVTNGASLGLCFADSESCGWSDGNSRGGCKSSRFTELS